MHVIRPFMSYASVIWTSCDKEQLYRVLKLQKRVARVILYADRQASSVALFNKLSWIPFYEQPMTDKCSISYKRINGTLPSYLMLLRRKFLLLFPSFFNINLLYMFKIIQIAKNWNDTCVRGLEISHWKVRKYRPPLQSSQSNSPRDLRKAVVRLSTWFLHCDVETSTKRFAFGKSMWL